jgi:purine-nucleoside phosphorylase
MSLNTDRHEFDLAYAARSEKTWSFEAGSARPKIIGWAPNYLIVSSTPIYGKEISGLLDKVVERDQWSNWQKTDEPIETIAGWYRGVPVSVFHTGITPVAFGASYMDFTLEQLRNRTGSRVILAGEMTSLQEEVRIGDLVVSGSSVRGDDSHLSYALPDLAATAHPFITQQLVASGRKSGRKTHVGATWSCGIGAGIFDPCLGDQAWAYHRLGVLGNALDAATAYLRAPILGINLSSIWLVADSLFEPIRWSSPFTRLGWADGWKDMVGASLDALYTLAKEEGSK